MPDGQAQPEELRLYPQEDFLGPGPGPRIKVIACPHPLRTTRLERWVLEGITLKGILEDVQPNPVLRAFAHISIEGEPIRANVWHRVKPKGGTVVAVRCVAQVQQGGENKDSTAFILQLAVTAAAMIVPGLGPVAALGRLAASAIGAGIAIIGNLAIRMLVGPQTGREEDFSGPPDISPTFFLEGAQNQARPNEVIPDVLGVHVIVPPLAALPTTEVRGNNQWIRAVYCCGLGPVEFGEIELEGTNLNAYQHWRLERRKGFADDPALRRYTNSIFERPLRVELKNKNKVKWFERTTEPDIDQISIDVTADALVRVQLDGDKKRAEVVMPVRYAPVGTNDWSTTDDGKFGGQRTLAGMPDPGIEHVPFRDGGGVDIVKHQVHRIVMDPFSLELEIESSPVVDKEIQNLVGALPGGVFEPEDPFFLAPAFPRNKISLAEVYRVGGDVNINSDVITDQRPNTTQGRMFPGASKFNSTNDFEVTPTSPATGDSVLVATGTIFNSGFVVLAKRRSTVRRNITFDVPRGPAYRVQIRRKTRDDQENDPRFDKTDTFFDTFFWTALRSIRADAPIKKKGLALLSLEIRSSGQLNGQLGQLRVKVRRRLPDWNGTIWKERVTRNPASILRHVWQGPGNALPLPDSEIDITSLEAFHTWCTTKGYHFDYPQDTLTTVEDLSWAIVRAGRAALTAFDGKYGVVIDEPKTVSEAIYGPRNSFGFNARKPFIDLPDGIRSPFRDRKKGYRQNEVWNFRAGFDIETALNVERLEHKGVTDGRHIKVLNRYHLAQAELRPEDFEWFCDVQALQHTRGDLIRHVHDVPLHGLKQGRVTAVVVGGSGEAISATLDEVVPMAPGLSYSIRFSLPDGSEIYSNVVTVVGDSTDVTFNPAIPAPLIPAIGDIFAFGESGQESVDMIINEIHPLNDLQVRVLCQHAAPGVHDAADNGTTPVFDPQISIPPGTTVPIVADIRSDEEVLLLSQGAPRERMVVDFYLPSGLPHDVDKIEGRMRELEGATDETGAAMESEVWDSLPLFPVSPQIVIDQVETGDELELQFRFIKGSGNPGPWGPILAHTVIGGSTLPPDVPNLMQNGDSLTWTYPAPPRDHAGFLVRSHAGDNRSWDNATKATPDDQPIPGPPFSLDLIPGGVRTVMVKAVDIFGNQSAGAATAVLNLGDPIVKNVVLSEDRHPLWPGTLTGGSIQAGELIADNLAVHWTGDDTNVWWKGEDGHVTWSPQFDRMVHEFSFTPDGPGRLLIAVDIDASDGWELEIREAFVSPLWKGDDNNVIWTGDDANVFWSAEPGVYFAWPGEFNVEKREYDIRLTTFAGQRQATVRGLTLTLDVEDVLIQVNDFAVPAAGGRLPLGNTPITVITGVRFTLQDDGGDAVGVRYVDLDPILGPFVRAPNGATPPVGTTALIDAQIQGYNFVTT